MKTKITVRDAKGRALKMPRCARCHRSDRVVPSPVMSLQKAGVVRCLRCMTEWQPGAPPGAKERTP